MPNWCSNTLTLSHDNPAMITRAQAAFDRGEFLHEFVPVPQELKDAVADSSTNEALVAKYGYSNWYDFCISEWGTKWDVGDGSADVIDENTLTLSFESAWAPPVVAYEKFLDLGFRVYAQYYEPGVGFVGTWDNGDDEYYDYHEETADTVRSVIGEELDDAWGISESMAEWEEENAEDEGIEQDEA